jgi:hypothetical protein
MNHINYQLSLRMNSTFIHVPLLFFFIIVNVSLSDAKHSSLGCSPKKYHCSVHPSFLLFDKNCFTFLAVERGRKVVEDDFNLKIRLHF